VLITPEPATGRDAARADGGIGPGNPHPDVVYVPIPDLTPDQVCLAVAATHTSPVVDDFVAAAQSTAEITAECGNYEMWQLGGDAVTRHA
jgi:hypothetical protein